MTCNMQIEVPQHHIMATLTLYLALASIRYLINLIKIINLILFINGERMLITFITIMKMHYKLVQHLKVHVILLNGP